MSIKVACALIDINIAMQQSALKRNRKSRRKKTARHPSQAVPVAASCRGQRKSYQMITRSLGARYILSPCFTPNAE